jgi:hypothetical protein
VQLAVDSVEGGSNVKEIAAELLRALPYSLK